MKISFTDNSYIECRQMEDGKIIFIISAVDGTDKTKRIANSVELDLNQFKQLISEVLTS